MIKSAESSKKFVSPSLQTEIHIVTAMRKKHIATRQKGWIHLQKEYAQILAEVL
jgi:hypothetical protein